MFPSSGLNALHRGPLPPVIPARCNNENAINGPVTKTKVDYSDGESVLIARHHGVHECHAVGLKGKRVLSEQLQSVVNEVSGPTQGSMAKVRD